MSLKSFDKFCEKMILGEPANQKEIMDERQKIVRTRILVEALVIFSGLSFINCWVMDMAYQWTETYAAPMMMFFMICMIYFNIRCFAKGCLIGINGGGQAKFTAFYAIFMGALSLIRDVFRDESERALFSDGKLTDDLCILITWILFIVFGAVSLILIKLTKRSEKGE
ncbi:MAG: hypothetical protein K2N56_00990 [Oscillospiraceae bacterium]|nr:hypothetical protein [Oscillospiraceae bacterium]